MKCETSKSEETQEKHGTTTPKCKMGDLYI
jgi:hypothetical protein